MSGAIGIFSDREYAGHSPLYASFMYKSAVHPMESVIERKVLFTKGLEVYSLLRNMCGYIISPLVDERSNSYISVRYTDRVVHVYSVNDDISGNIYPRELYCELEKDEGYFISSFKNEKAVDRYSPDRKFTRVQTCEYTYSLFYQDQRKENWVRIEDEEWIKRVISARKRTIVKRAPKPDAESKWEGIVEAFNETTAYTGRADNSGYSPVQDYIDYIQNHLE